MTPHLDRMASGNSAIVLQDGVSYDNFPAIADYWVQRLSLIVIKNLDGPDARIWDCLRDGKKFWLSFDDWFPEIHLEPQDDIAGAEIENILNSI